MFRKSLLSCIAVVCTLLITACSKPVPSTTNTASTPKPALQPCSLVTQDEVEIALGKGATMTPETNPRTGMEECTLRPDKAAELDRLTLVLHDATSDSWEKLKSSYAQDPDVKPIPGLGDDALNVGKYGVWARKGNTYMQIFGAIKSQRNEKAELYLAERAVSRL